MSLSAAVLPVSSLDHSPASFRETFIPVPTWLLRLPDVSHGAKIAYGRLSLYAGKDSYAYPKLPTLASEIGASERQTRRYIRELESAGLIFTERRGLTKSNRYHFLPPRAEWITPKSGRSRADAEGRTRADISGRSVYNMKEKNREKTTTKKPAAVVFPVSDPDPETPSPDPDATGTETPTKALPVTATKSQSNTLPSTHQETPPEAEIQDVPNTQPTVPDAPEMPDTGQSCSVAAESVGEAENGTETGKNGPAADPETDIDRQAGEALKAVRKGVVVSAGLRKIIRRGIERHGLDYVLRNIAYANRHIRNLASYRAYLDRAIREDWGVDEPTTEADQQTDGGSISPAEKAAAELADRRAREKAQAEADREAAERAGERYRAMPPTDQERLRADFLRQADAFTRRRAERLSIVELSRNYSFCVYLDS